MKREISNNKLQLDSLDGLRGLAALIVILSHTSNASMFFVPYFDARGVGKSGVFLFFLLSSFLLSRALIKQNNIAFSMPALSLYFQRRFFRIYPLYVPYLVLGLVSTYIFTTIFEKENLGFPFTLTLTELFNHLILIEGKGVTWSVAVEFKFYFCLPIIIYLIQLINAKFGVVWELVLLITLVALTQIVSFQGDSVVNDSRLMPYMCIFLWGTILAVIQCEIEADKIKRENLELIVPLSYLSLLTLIVMTPEVTSLIFGYVENSYYHKDFIQHAILWSVVLLSVVNFNSKLSSFFESNWLVFYGSLSFSIYLFHPIFIQLAKHFSMGTYVSAWFVLAGSTASSYVSFKLLELPASQFKFSFLSKR